MLRSAWRACARDKGDSRHGIRIPCENATMMIGCVRQKMSSMVLTACAHGNRNGVSVRFLRAGHALRDRHGRDGVANALLRDVPVSWMRGTGRECGYGGQSCTTRSQAWSWRGPGACATALGAHPLPIQSCFYAAGPAPCSRCAPAAPMQAPCACALSARGRTCLHACPEHQSANLPSRAHCRERARAACRRSCRWPPQAAPARGTLRRRGCIGAPSLWPR